MPSHDIEINGGFIVNTISVIEKADYVDVYSLSGIKLKSKLSVKDLTNELADGLYIINGKTVLLRRR